MRFLVLLSSYSTIGLTYKYFYGKRARIRIRFMGLLMFMGFCYTTWFIFFRPLVFGLATPLYSLAVTLGTFFSFYYLGRSIYSDPGFLPRVDSAAGVERKNECVLSLVNEKDHEFCAACIVRKPLRSKHCGVCNRCVSKFDHHCPWVNNCIGERNMKYFAAFCCWSHSIFLLYLHGAAVCKTPSLCFIHIFRELGV